MSFDTQSHEDAMEIILATSTVASLSLEEVIAIYLRIRGILNDGEEILASPIPADWQPPRRMQ